MPGNSRQQIQHPVRPIPLFFHLYLLDQCLDLLAAHITMGTPIASRAVFRAIRKACFLHPCLLRTSEPAFPKAETLPQAVTRIPLQRKEIAFNPAPAAIVRRVKCPKLLIFLAHHSSSFFGYASCAATARRTILETRLFLCTSCGPESMLGFPDLVDWTWGRKTWTESRGLGTSSSRALAS